jgi:lactate permease
VPYFLALLPILIVLALMLLLRWGGQFAGPVGLLAGIAVAIIGFGLTPQVFWVSQAKGVLLSLYVLAVLWPALLLYNTVNEAGGIRAVAHGLKSLITDHGVLLIVMAWAFSGLLEGLAGFGLPIAVVAPMLASLGVAPVMAVAAVAVGHSWSVTFGDMGVIYQTLVSVVQIDGALLAPAAAIILGIACLACGFATAHILRLGHRWQVVLVLAIAMAVTQGLLAVSGLTALGALGAGIVGVGGGVLLGNRSMGPQTQRTKNEPMSSSLKAALVTYGALALLMTLIALVQPLRTLLATFVWQADFPAVVTLNGFATPAGTGQVFRPFIHPGTAILLVAIVSFAVYRRRQLIQPGAFRSIMASTWRAAAPSSAGILSMVGLAALMDHCGMTIQLAQGLSAIMGGAFPLVSPLVGMLGAFATGSNNNSNVLFGSLQKSAAEMLMIDPRVLIATQTAGGSLGSMIAPAKIIVGCSTVGAKGRDGDVLRITVPYGLAIAIGIGLIVLLWTIIVR